MLTLIPRPRSDQIPLEAECIRPDLLTPLSLPQIESLPVYQGNAEARLADFFAVRGDPSDGHVEIDGDCATVKRLGAGMGQGSLIVHGNVGMHLGAAMTGGLIEVHGDAGDWAGAEMAGGRIHLHGNGSDRVGSSYLGSKLGMTGGVILVDGNVGTEAGATMRRGLIAVGGNAGAFAGVSMIAGSILIFGQAGLRCGAGMKRGTIGLLGGAPERLLPTFQFACEYRPTFLASYFKKLQEWGLQVTGAAEPVRPFRVYRGDMVELGKGEMLIATA